MKLYLYLFTGCILVSCSKNPVEKTYRKSEDKVSITTGVYGTVTFREGNCMPGVGNRTCKEYPMQRTVRIYTYTRASQAIPATSAWKGFYGSFSTPLIKEVTTDTDGFYEAGLPPGQYTLVVVENGLLYAREYEGTPPDLGINPFTITTDRLKKKVVIDYKAAY